MEETIDLREYFAIIKKRFWIIALIAIIATTVSGIISYIRYVPVYQAQTTLIVSAEPVNGNTVLTGDQMSVTQKLAVLYGEVIKSRAVLEPVIKDLNLDMSYNQLAASVSVTPVNETQIMNLMVQDTNPERARDIANKIPNVFSKEAKRITNANKVEVIDKAILSKVPVNSNKTMNMVIAAVLGVMIGLFVIFLIEYLDNKIKTPQDIQKHLELPILGVIPDEGLIK
ncbi:YveK family protein [Romboutsia lituseburensis]|uniref:YveK family protein n=1 Tax=Romboutsia lituseburensis TaxID=1537 RepID=UPI00215A57D2|nr:Wzz/FepE/Etk N-terminal domain-containing protein [Romboutsia lituseburensis]MCR8746788.1 Wzz/FepE/Etk N-terminal domain-containing protein [Romboutsia lituseburensis]